MTFGESSSKSTGAQHCKAADSGLGPQKARVSVKPIPSPFPPEVDSRAALSPQTPATCERHGLTFGKTCYKSRN